MELDISEFLQAHLYLFGSYELPTVRFIRKLLSKGGTAVDVGAQIGYLTLVMAMSGEKSATVYSFEPEPENIRRFNRNIHLNTISNVTLIQKAVSNTNSPIKLYLSADHNAGTHSTIASDPNVSSQYIEIPAVTLDTVVSEHNITELSLVKIDVEGAELEVIQGAQNTIQELQPTFIIELSEVMQQSRGFSSPKFKQMMKEFNYSPFEILDNGQLLQISLEKTHAMDNIVFIHKNRLDTLHYLISPLRA